MVQGKTKKIRKIARSSGVPPRKRMSRQTEDARKRTREVFKRYALGR